MKQAKQKKQVKYNTALIPLHYLYVSWRLDGTRWDTPESFSVDGKGMPTAFVFSSDMLLMHALCEALE